MVILPFVLFLEALFCIFWNLKIASAETTTKSLRHDVGDALVLRKDLQSQQQEPTEISERRLQQAQQQQLSSSFLGGFLQSGPDALGDSFASTGYVDSSTQTLHIVGTTYGKWWTTGGNATSKGNDDPDCFYAVANMPQVTSANKISTSMDFIHTELLGKASVAEACYGFLLDRVKKGAFLVGSTNSQGGLLRDLFDGGQAGAEFAKQIGMILDYSVPDDQGPTNAKPLQLVGGRVMIGAPVVYPVAIAGPNTGQGIFNVAYMESTDYSNNAAWPAGEQLDPAEVMQFGKSFYLRIAEHKIADSSGATTSSGTTVQPSVLETITRLYAPTKQETVYVSALLRLSDRLIVAGYTQGIGIGFSVPTSNVDSNNTDGFVTQFALSTLQPFSNAPTYRVASGRDDFVTGLCYSDQKPEFVYVTGYSQGHVGNRTQTPQDPDTKSIRAFVMKLQLSDMTTVWIQEFNAKPSTNSTSVVKAISCAVTNDNQDLYVVGNVENGGAITGPGSDNLSVGGIDVWIAQLKLDSGSVVFVKQLGSKGDDKVAFRGGVQVDESGNAVLIGNTNGQIYRPRSKTDQANADVFVAMFQRQTGSFVLPLDNPNFVSLPPKNSRPTMGTTPPPQQSSGTTNQGSSFRVVLMVFLILGVVSVIGFIIYWNFYHISRRELATDRSKVLDYLHDFDVEDIDLKHSATGGWHCCYVNDLAQGINKQVKGDLYSAHRDRLYFGDGGGSVYDPLTNGLSGSNAGSGRPSRSRRNRLSDDNNLYDKDTEETVTFGISRDSRKERDQKLSNEGLLATDPDQDGSPDSKKQHRSRFGRSTNTSLLSSGSRRINRAKERWENREII